MKYITKGTCSREINFEVVDGKLHNVSYLGGCNGNLKAVARLVDGYSVEQIEERCKGITCGFKPTSCADQLAQAVREAYEYAQKQNS